MKIGSLLLKSPPKMALAINSFWKNGTHGVGYGSNLFDNESSFFHSPCVDLNGIPYNSSNSTYIDLESPNYGNMYKYTFYIKGDDHHNDYSTNVYAVDLTAPVSGNYLMVYLFKGPDVGGTASSTQRLRINTYTIEYCVGENTETSGDIGHYIDIIVPLDLFYRDKDYATIGSKAVRISRPRIKDRFYAYWA